MNLKTAYSGEIEINTAEILKFEHGIPGFETEKEFVLLPIKNNREFTVLQSVQTEALAFIVANPYNITVNYNIELEVSTVHALQIKDQKEVAVFAVVSLKETIAESTVNLKAPIILNTSNKKAKQIILNNEDYNIRQPLSSESQKG